eukprot:CCRYP_008544-RD/>CCRYP_008544-RD protein AED:0.19 eAED:0.19 QI:217/0.8/0.83/1/0.8/0.83/6/602/2020
MRRQPVNHSPSSFDGSAFFGSDAAGSERDDFFGELSKFESFIERKSRRAGGAAAGNAARGISSAHNSAQDVISPRSDDGMSFVSRKKHDNYANVVMEMKMKQSNGNSGQTGWPMHEETGWQEDGWNSFGNTNHFQQQQQQKQQPQQKKPQHQPQQQRFQWHDPAPTNKSRANILNPPSAPFPSPPQRTGRKLYRENSVVTSVNSNSAAPQAAIPNQRSRSTVRRTADLQRKIAQTWVTQRHKDDDEVSDAGSAISSVFLGNSNTMAGSGSWGDEFRSFGSASFGSGEPVAGGGGSGGGGTQRKPKKGLDSLFNKKQFTQGATAVESDTASVVSGTGSVAARRRAKAALKNNNSPHRPSGLGNVAENSASSTQQLTKNCAPIQPPPSNSAVGARRNMRMRMQNKTSSFGSNGSQQSSMASGRSFPFKHEQNNFESSFNAFQLDSSVIDEEVNSALKELKLDHPEMDFAFNRLGSSHSRGNSVDSSTSGFHSSGADAGGGGGGGGGIVGGGYHGESPLKHNFKKEVTKGRNSPITVGSIKTLTTKSVTVESSVDSTTNQNHNQHIAVPSLRVNHYVGRPIPSGNTTLSSFGNSNKPIISPNVISVVEQFSESVERCSESSSLTDTSDWHHGTGGPAGVSSVVGGATNMFKDASKGSTFHKSKKIIRPGESIPENNVAGGSRYVPSLNAPTGSDCVASDAEKEKDVDVALVLPSIKDRISQFKNSAITTTPTQQSLASPPLPQKIHSPVYPHKDEPTAPEKSSPFSGTSNNITPSFRRRNNELPPHAPTSGQSPPFQVKLRKTKNILNEIADNTKDLDTDRDKEVDTATSSPNPFLSQVKLRSTGKSWRDKQREVTQDTGVESENCPQNESKPTTPAASNTSEEPKRKLTYREQQELLKQKQEKKETPATTVEEPTKDIATLIRERIAMNKQQSNFGTPQSEKGSSELNISSLRGNLKRTSFGKSEISTPTNIREPPDDSSIIAEKQTFSQSNTHQHVAVTNNLKRSSEKEATPEQALNSMLANRFGSPAKEEKKVEPTPDPREALMAALHKRADKAESTPVSDPRSALMTAISKRGAEKEEQPVSDPRAALMAAISKRTSPPPVDDDSESEVMDPRANLASMLQNRVAQTSGGAGTPSKVNAKNNLSAMLAKRAPPPDVNDTAVDASATNGRPALKDDPKYEKYFKMLKVGMPLPAVQHAMTRDGLDPSIMEYDHNKPAPEPKSEGVPLKEDPAYEKYFKMLKLGLPMGAVKNAMERDGLDSSIMDGDHNAPASSQISDSPATKKRQKDTHRRTRLHWDTPVGKVKSNTVWALVNKDEELENIVIDEKEFTNLFQAELKASSVPAERSNSSARNVVQVIDPKRANNGGIILARLRMSYDDMAKAVEKIDETAMTANQAQGIVEYMPTRDERKKLREYMKGGDGDSASKFEKLCECEKFMVAMMTVKQSKRKLRALLFKLQFRGCIHDLAHEGGLLFFNPCFFSFKDVFSIEKACDELSNSIRLRKLFGIVLNIGNRLNTAGPGEKRKAGAFTIKSLLKLNQAKAFDNKTTFLHYVVLVVQRNNEYLLDFKDDLPTTLKADKIFWDQCVNELEEVETQLENVRKLALHEAKSSKFIYSLPNKSKDQEDNDSDDLSIASMSLEDEVALLRSTKIGMFALSAIKKVSQLRERVDTARDKFCQLLEYFGEDGDSSNMQPHELFEIISTFCRNFDVARDDVMKMEKEKKRADKKEKNEDNSQKVDGSSKNTKQTITPQRTPNSAVASIPKKNIMLRSSSFQPNMSNVLSDLKRATSKTQSESCETCETPSQGRSPQSSHLASSKATRASTQHSAPQSSQNTSSSADETPLQCKNTGRKRTNNVPKPSELENNAPLKPKGLQNEPVTPERPSPIPSQSSNRTAAQCTALDVQQSSEPVTKSIQVSSSETSSELNTTPPQKVPPLSRRVRIERVRHRNSTLSSSEADSLACLPPPVSNSKPTATATETPPNNAPMTTPSPAPSNASARAAARDRYARHKKMMHQRHTTT